MQYGDGAALDPDAQFEALSLTKTIVAAVALQLVDEARAHTRRAAARDRGHPRRDDRGLDPADGCSVIRPGLRDYRESTEYRADMILTPVAAVNLAAAQSDLTSTNTSYAAPNFLLAGLVIETVTGEPLSQVLDDRIFEPFGMDAHRDGQQHT